MLGPRHCKYFDYCQGTAKCSRFLSQTLPSKFFHYSLSRQICSSLTIPILSRGIEEWYRLTSGFFPENKCATWSIIQSSPKRVVYSLRPRARIKHPRLPPNIIETTRPILQSPASTAAATTKASFTGLSVVENSSPVAPQRNLALWPWTPWPISSPTVLNNYFGT